MAGDGRPRRLCWPYASSKTHEFSEQTAVCPLGSGPRGRRCYEGASRSGDGGRQKRRAAAVTLLTVVMATIKEERMTTATTRQAESTASPVLMMAFELAEKYWKLGFTTGSAQRARRRQIPARDVEVLELEIAAAKRRFGLAPDAPVMSCYEAGREGFWLHRWLVAHGVHNVVVDSSSIEATDERGGRRPTASTWT